MLKITYFELCIAVTVIWIIIRAAVGIRRRRFSAAEELKMLLVYICIIVIARFVNFPLHHINGKIGTMKLDPSVMFPPRVNLVPIVHLFDVYDGWQINIIGNIAMFIPVGIVWPVCFEKLDSIGKTVLAGAGFTLVIEILQLPFYERCSDIDDIILNTAGAAIGAIILFGIRRFHSGRHISSEKNC